MTANRVFEMCGYEVEFMVDGKSVAMLLTADLLNDIDFNDTVVVETIAYVFRYLPSAVRFEHLVSCYKGEYHYMRLFGEVYNRNELHGLLDNPLLGDVYKQEITSYFEWLTRQSKKKSKKKNRTPTAGYIYLIQANLPGVPCKIGRTKNLPDRMSIFGIKLPFDFELIHTIPTDDAHQAESKLHKQFKNKRGNGEWFNLSPDDIETIKKMT